VRISQIPAAAASIHWNTPITGTVAPTMQRFGTLSFGHYGPLGAGRELTARDNLHQAIELAQAMDELGVNGTYFRVHHFAKQHSSPIPLMSAIAAKTAHIEVGTGVIDMRYRISWLQRPFT
jgi:alkanesulfonate monooxygenase SsuD/methylene tetrahydromethanopterin reductase-like flavin-dependent oxidoreductase (luciferase family)